MPYPENNLLRHRHRQIFMDEPPKDEPELIDGWLTGFIERLTRIIHIIGGKK